MTGIALLVFIVANVVAIALVAAVVALITRPGTRTRAVIDRQLDQLRAALNPVPAGSVQDRRLQAAIEDDQVSLAAVVELAERAAEREPTQRP